MSSLRLSSNPWQNTQGIEFQLHYRSNHDDRKRLINVYSALTTEILLKKNCMHENKLLMEDSNYYDLVPDDKSELRRII